jgi:hypothetical protein
VPTAMQVEKNPKLKTRKQQRNKQASPEVVVVEFEPFDTQIEEPLRKNRAERKRGNRSQKCQVNQIGRPG